VQRATRVGAALAGAVLAVALGVVLPSGAAQAAADPGPLVLSSVPDPLGMSPIGAGGHVRWTIRAELVDHASADLFLRIVGHDPMATDPAGLTVQVDRCGGAWSTAVVTPTCATGDATTPISDTPVATLPTTAERIATLASGQPRELLFTLSLPAAAGNAFLGSSGRLDLVFTADGDSETVSVGGSALPTTGVEVAGPALIAVGLVVGGVVLGLLRRRRREPVG
jgi:LPXTG-motif cell wall-anchored protein